MKTYGGSLSDHSRQLRAAARVMQRDYECAIEAGATVVQDEVIFSTPGQYETYVQLLAERNRTDPL